MTMRRGWFHLATGAGVGRIFGFLSNLLLSRLLGPIELGLFNLVTTTVQTCDTLVRLGGDYALNFELGGHPQAFQTERGQQLARAFAQITSLSTAAFCAGTAIWIWFGQGIFSGSISVSQRFLLSGTLLLMIACEGCSVSAWEMLLVSHRTAPLALRQGLFFPLRLLFAAACALFTGVLGAMCGWCFIALVQVLWLRIVLPDLWNPLQVWPILWHQAYQLLRRGLPFYGANLLASLVFYPLLLKVASGAGLAEVGYLRVGQIVQQLFAFLPATLVPVLFLKLRSESHYSDQVSGIERPLRMTWFLLLEVLLLYSMIDQSLITWLFGNGFASALLPTRLLLLTALFECLAQLLVQPLLASGQIRMYAIWQNGSAALAAILGWLWIPSAGLPAYLIVRLIYVVVPLLYFALAVFSQLQKPQDMLPLALVTAMSSLLLVSQALNLHPFVTLTPILSASVFVLLAFLQRRDVVYAWKLLTVAS